MTDAQIPTPESAPVLAITKSPPTNEDTAHDRRIFWMGTAILIMVLVIVLLLFFITIPAANKDVLNTVIGAIVGSGFGSVVGFYYGSSQSSKTKDDTITNLTKADAAAPPAQGN
jgi:hypothetical protein